jgi:hypothetical protein
MTNSGQDSDKYRHIALAPANRVIRRRGFAALLIWPLLVACGSQSSSGSSATTGMAGSGASGGLSGAGGISNAAGSNATGGATSAGGDNAGGSHAGNADAGSAGNTDAGNTNNAGAGNGGVSSGGSGNAGSGNAGGGSGAAKYYVGGAQASDSNPGTSDLPFATIQACAAVVLPGETCNINSGIYRETVTPAHSGTANAPIAFRAVPGANVTIDGTDAVATWTKDTGSIYKATVQLSGSAAQPYSATEYPANSELWANQIFIAADMVPEAAYPPPSASPWTQASASGFSSTRSDSTSCTTQPCAATMTGTLTYNAFPAFGDMKGAVLYFTGGWVAMSAQVTSGTLSATQHTLQISLPVSDSKVSPGGGNDDHFRLVGKKAFLIGANQWSYDPVSTTLYLWTPSGALPTQIFAKKRNYGFDLRGKSYLSIVNVSLFATTVTTDDTSTNDVLDGVHGQYLSHWQSAQYDSSLPFAGIYDANHRFDSGILLHGKNHTLKNSVLEWSSGNGVNVRGSGSTVSNNSIHDVGYGGTYTAAITIEVGSHDLQISNNSLFNTGRDVINMDTNAYPNAGYQNIRISYNDIHGYARTNYDLGGIYACCDTALTGTRIDHNWIHEPANTGNGIHFDNGTYDVSVDHNVIWGLNGVGDVNHGGNGVNFGGHTNARPAGSNLPYLKGVFYNNTIVSGPNNTIDNYFASAAEDANMTVRNNILDGYHPEGQNFGYIAGGTPVQDHNLVTLYSQNGSGTNPRYTMPTSADFSLQTSSPAIDAGTLIPGITDGYQGAAPDQGAYEAGTAKWVPGASVGP